MAIRWIVLHSICILYCLGISFDQYNILRNQIIKEELEFHFDYNVTLSSLEKEVNYKLRDLRSKEIRSFSFYAPDYNFREAKGWIDQNSDLYKLLKKMPKGAIQHIHAIGDAHKAFMYGSYRNDCYIYVSTDIKDPVLNGSFRYFPAGSKIPTGYKNVVELRSKSANITEFDLELFKTTQFYTPNLDISENDMWVYFDKTIGRAVSLTGYQPVWEYLMLEAFHDLVNNDNIQLIELRGLGDLAYDVNGNSIDEKGQIDAWLNLIKKFNSQSPNKIDMRFIYVVLRKDNAKTTYQRMLDCVNLRKQYPMHVMGFDLVDQEDRYHTLYYYIHDFLNLEDYLASNNLPPMKYYFHAGETDWSNRYNLFDAVLLNSSRIGHGYALPKYPRLMEAVKQQDICIEVCPISNQLLRLVNDIRNHPAEVLLNNDIAVSINSDDPVIYGYTGVTYDYYISFMAWNSLDVKSLKKLAMNSIIYSTLRDNPATKEDLQNHLKVFERKWEDWINWVLTQ